MESLELLGHRTPNRFLRDYWHKKPLLVRQAFPSLVAPITPEQLFELARTEDTESRLVSKVNNSWQLKHGPFDTLPSRKKKNWSLLVQGVNLHNEQAHQFLRQFNFLPEARLDDLMISFATDGGGVGPHFDSYDVFLIQVHGQRRWQISAQANLELIDGLPLKILKNFAPEEELILNPGDMLYLPPHYAHDGVAIGDCMTYSVGFRAPTNQEMGEAFLQFMSDSIDLPGRYGDPELKYSNRPAELSKDMVNKVSQTIKKIAFTKGDIAIFLGEYLSSPKPTVFFDSPHKPETPRKFAQLAMQSGVALSPKSRMLYRGKHVFVNGESFSVTGQDKQILNKLANTGLLEGEDVSQASPDLVESLCQWYEDGWLNLNRRKKVSKRK